MSLTKNNIRYNNDIFIQSIEYVRDVFIKENIDISFDNYLITMDEYNKSKESDLNTLKELIIDINLWFSYIGDLEGLTQSILLKKINIKNYIDAFKLSAKSEIASNNTSADIFKLKVFLKQLRLQKRLLSNMSYNCLDLYNLSCHRYLY